MTLKGNPYILAVKVFLSSPPGFDIVALMRWFSIMIVLLFVFGKVPLRSVIVALRAFIENSCYISLSGTKHKTKRVPSSL